MKIHEILVWTSAWSYGGGLKFTPQLIYQSILSIFDYFWYSFKGLKWKEIEWKWIIQNPKNALFSNRNGLQAESGQSEKTKMGASKNWNRTVPQRRLK